MTDKVTHIHPKPRLATTGDNFRPAKKIPLDLLPADIMAAARDDAALRQVVAELEADVARLNAALRAVVARLDGGPGGAA